MRGEIMRGFDVIDNWDVETKETDKDRFGEPFHYPNTFLLLLGYAKAFFHLSYTQTKKGIAQNMLDGKYSLSIQDYSTISIRINRLDIKTEEDKYRVFEDDCSIIAIDNTDIKVTNIDQWMKDK
jgi:hypothetical protein